MKPLLAASPLLLAALLSAQSRYAVPPQPIADCITSSPPPSVSLNPTREYLVLTTQEGMPSIATVARPTVVIAGSRIDPRTRGSQRGSRGLTITLQKLSDGSQKAIPVPQGGDVSGPSWNAKGTHFTFTNTTPDAIELWLADAAAGTCKKIEGVKLNATYGGSSQWHSNQTQLICKLVANEGQAPAKPEAPSGPNVEETKPGKKAPVRTYQGMLQSEYDEQLFDFYMTSQIALVDVASGAVKKIGQPGLYSGCDPSPDGKYLLVTKTKKPYSYRIGSREFPREVTVWDAEGKQVAMIADQPSGEGVPIEGVPLGRRGIGWVSTSDCTLQWTEALDGGDPKAKAEHRDKVSTLEAPFTGEGKQLYKTQHRAGGGTYIKDLGVVYSESDRDTKWTKTWHLAKPGAEPTLLWERDSQDGYADPGSFVSRVNARGDSEVIVKNGAVFLQGSGASPKGDHPFLDRYEFATKKKERLYHCPEGCLERVTAVLDDEASKLVLTRETKTEVGNYFLFDRKSGERKQLTKLTDPLAEATKGITKQRIEYKRADGCPMTATLYLPPQHKEGMKWPVLVWAYPREYVDAKTAGQVRGSEHTYTRLSPSSHLLVLLAGYAVFDEASMPVIGTPEKANDTFVEQIVACAQAAIDKCNSLGIAQPNRFAVGGHSYGSFMTANLLAHCDLFRCGLARSGAFNRSLTPFGFQSERRTYWEAIDIYTKMSPFTHAHKINEPILLIHGEQDSNPGTFPIQSTRLFQAIMGHGGCARLVFLPFEDHGYRAKESNLHVMAEQLAWLDKYCKGDSR